MMDLLKVLRSLVRQMDALQEAISHLDQSLGIQLEAQLARNVELETQMENKNQRLEKTNLRPQHALQYY